MPFPDPSIEVLTAFRPVFTAPTWRKLMIELAWNAPDPRTPYRRSRPAREWQQYGGQLESLSSGAQPSTLVSVGGESSIAPTDRQDVCASRSLCGSGD